MFTSKDKLFDVCLKLLFTTIYIEQTYKIQFKQHKKGRKILLITRVCEK